MHTIHITDTGMASGAFEAAEFFKANPRCTRVRITNRYTEQGQPAHEWHYKGPRKDLSAIYEAMTMVSCE